VGNWGKPADRACTGGKLSGEVNVGERGSIAELDCASRQVVVEKKEHHSRHHSRRVTTMF